MKHIVAITMGDPGGIGPEIMIKAFAGRRLNPKILPLAVGDARLLAETAQAHRVPVAIRPVHTMAELSPTPGVLNVWDMSSPDSVYTMGKPSAANGAVAFQCIRKSVELAMAGSVTAVTTGPISKEALHMAGHLYPGHTEIFASLTGTADYAMLLVSKRLKVIHATTHMALSQVGASLTVGRIVKVIGLARQAGAWFGLSEPRIAVAGLNPHCSENGLFGHEEAEVIAPAVARAKEMGYLAEGPIPPDTVFVKALCGQYDFVVAMYHDQGHIPLKMDGFRVNPETGAIQNVGGVNVTAGLPIIRTSVDYGTAFDLAGLWKASEESMEDAVNLAAIMAEHRGWGITRRKRRE